MNDKELLELAAKAAGATWIDETFPYEEFGRMIVDFGKGVEGWSPLDDDGDALRLAVKLRMRVDITADGCLIDCAGQLVEIDSDPYAATRRAIVRAAAAEIGKGVK